MACVVPVGWLEDDVLLNSQLAVHALFAWAVLAYMYGCVPG